MHRSCLLLMLMATPLAAQHNLPESGAASLPCPGPPHVVPLAPGDFLDLGGASAHLTFGPGLHLCISETEVTIHHDDTTQHACTDIRDSENEGVGHYFTAEDMPYHLWLHINPADSAPTLQVGLYREETELVWIETGVAICTR